MSQDESTMREELKGADVVANKRKRNRNILIAVLVVLVLFGGWCGWQFVAGQRAANTMVTVNSWQSAADSTNSHSSDKGAATNSNKSGDGGNDSESMKMITDSSQSSANDALDTTESGEYVDASADAKLATRDYDAVKQRVSELLSEHNGRVVSRDDTSGGGWSYTIEQATEKSKAARKMVLSLYVPTGDIYSFMDAVSAIDGVTVESLSITADDVTDEVNGIVEDNHDKIEQVQSEIDELQRYLALTPDEAKAQRDAIDEQLRDYGLYPSGSDAREAKVSSRNLLNHVVQGAGEDSLAVLKSELESLQSETDEVEHAFDEANVSLTLYEMVDVYSNNPSPLEQLGRTVTGGLGAGLGAFGILLGICCVVLPFAIIGVVVVLVADWRRSKRDAQQVIDVEAESVDGMHKDEVSRTED